MNLTNLFKFALLTVLFCSCSSTDEPIPASYAEGKYRDNRVELIYNGVKDPDARVDIIMYKDDEERHIPGSDADARIVFKNRVFVVSEDDPLFPENYGICHYYIANMEFDVKLTSVGDKILFEGVRETYREGADFIRYYIEGYYHYYEGAFGKVPLNINIRSEVYKEGLTGRTFEMVFGDESPEISNIRPFFLRLPRTGQRAGVLIKELHQLSVSHFVERSGFESMRFTFKEDGTIEVEGRNATDGSSKTLDTGSHYFMAKGGYFLMQYDMSWADGIVTMFSPYDSPTSGNGSSFEFTITPQGVPVSVMESTNIAFKNDVLVITPKSGLCYDPVFKNSARQYLNQWVRNIDDDFFNKHNDLLFAADAGELSFEVSYKARLVE